MKKIIAFLLLGYSAISLAQETFPVNGSFNKNHNSYVFTNANIHVDYQTVISNGTLIIKDGLVVQARQNISIPAGSVIYDLKGKHIYPSLIDVYSNYGMPEIKSERGTGMPQMESKTQGAYNWNQAIKPETEAYKQFNNDSKQAEELRKMGFGSALTSQKDGIARGTATLVCLGDGRENEQIITDRAAALYSFSKGSSTQDYPSSLMGSIALLRQTYLDAEWYKNEKAKKEYNISLEAFNNIQTLPQIFETSNKLNALRADKVGDEFKVQYIIKGSGTEYQRINEIKNTGAKFIIPLNFPAAYDVEDPYDAAFVSLQDMKHWEMAPLNPSALEKNGIQFAITTSDLKEKKDFWKNLRKAIEYGLTEQQALKALTYTPAELIKANNKIGALKPGMLANFIITSENLFSEKNVIYENWIQGNQYRILDYNIVDVRGNYDLKFSDKSYTLKVEGEAAKPSAKIMLSDTVKIPVTISVSGRLITMNFNLKDDKGYVRLSGTIAETPTRFMGRGQLGNGDWFDWSASFKSAFVIEQKKDSLLKELPKLGDIIYPFGAYGKKAEDKPAYTSILIRNATVWTSEKEGILKNTDVLVTNGKIVAIGTNLSAPKDARIIDGNGKHLTAGIIDEHSHIGISQGVNEGGQASSAEVRIGDVIEPEDINIYRQLSGGVIASQLLHGSANPIGGQSALIKLRWGVGPEEMKIKDADGYIKFALGENVKQSNWGDFNTVRFPQTRMGVEQVFYDHFIRAKEYDARWKIYNSAKDKSKLSAPRRNLELDALVEILNKKRFITCHSYVQSEINMLMHVGDSMGFNVNTFTHILEGYKVADKMKQRGIGASSFSDWWSYKMEVKEAIPHNGAIMFKQGLVVAFNSDDAEMGRRLNQEAAKAVKYGNVPEEEAWKFVTLNPAKLLHLENRMGSVKQGKDADLVVWSDNPLSIYAKAEKTMVDGIVRYDIDEDVKMREEMRKERARLIQKMLAEKSKGEQTQKLAPKKQKLYHCDTMEENFEF
jgi:imidazolonepropionase-like amidohydrolase